MSRFLAAQLATSHYFNISPSTRDFGYEPKISIQKACAGLRRPIFSQRYERLYTFRSDFRDCPTRSIFHEHSSDSVARNHPGE